MSLIGLKMVLVLTNRQEVLGGLKHEMDITMSATYKYLSHIIYINIMVLLNERDQIESYHFLLRTDSSPTLFLVKPFILLAELVLKELCIDHTHL